MTTKLVDRKCVPCRGDVPRLKERELQWFLAELDKGWKVIRDHHLEKEYVFKNFREALEFTKAVGEIAEQEGHHPEITLAWGKVVLRIWTHKIDGLTESDFILAAKAEQAFRPSAPNPAA